MSVNGPSVLLWLTRGEYAALEQQVKNTGTLILQTARMRAENSRAFGAFDLIPGEPARLSTCPECLEPMVDCGCDLRDSRVASFRGREDYE